MLTRSRSGNYVATAGSVPFAGISQIERTLPAVDESTWMVSVEVEDVPRAVEKARSLGAEILQDTVTDNEFAVWAVIEDPQGALPSPGFGGGLAIFPSESFYAIAPTG